MLGAPTQKPEAAYFLSINPILLGGYNGDYPDFPGKISQERIGQVFHLSAAEAGRCE
jgi:hypothetical protein